MSTRTSLHRHDSVRERGKLLCAVASDQEVVLQAESSPTFSIASWLDCKHHALGDLASAGPVRVRRLVGACADAMADGVRRLPGEAEFLDSGPDAAVELGEARTGARVRDGVV